MLRGGQKSGDCPRIGDQGVLSGFSLSMVGIFHIPEGKLGDRVARWLASSALVELHIIINFNHQFFIFLYN
jgi:hypothetical protein